MDEKKNRNGNESGQPVRAAPFHGKKKYTARLYRKKSKDLSGLGKSVTDSVVQKQVVQNEEQETKAENEKLSSELLDAGKLSADRGRNLVRRTVIRRKKYSDRSKKLKKRENDADGLQRLKFENETVKNGKSNQKEQVKHFWKKKRQIRAFKESGNTIYETGTAGNVTLSNTKKLKGMLKRVFSGSKRTKMAVFSIGLIFFLLITSLGSCSSVIQGVGALVISTTYPSSDEAIYAVENHYKELEASLNQQINEMEKKHPGYEEYRYQIDEITHNPYHLISYLTAKYGEFTYEEVKEELKKLLQKQYKLETNSKTEITTETKTVTVGEKLGSVVTSGYCSCSICCGQWAGGATASGTIPQAKHTLAVDAKNPIVPLGTKIVMNGVEYTVEDTGTFAKYGVDFDVYYSSHSEALAHGHKTWGAYVADDNGSQSVEVTQTSEKKIFTVKLSNRGFDQVAKANLSTSELMLYELLNSTYGNRDYLFDKKSITNSGGGWKYDIPSEALSDERFAKMITEAEKYLGYPYVWGGASPETSFDCSGFVCWVINHCGNGWSVGRMTAEGLRGACTYVSPQNAKPGDLIFFEKTYETVGASHVGIYVGDGMMIHCGDPIQYTSINSAYWQEHFLGFGRLP